MTAQVDDAAVEAVARAICIARQTFSPDHKEPGGWWDATRGENVSDGKCSDGEPFFLAWRFHTDEARAAIAAMQAQHAEAIQAAREEMRERCARVAEERDEDGSVVWPDGHDIAAAIRALPPTPTKEPQT